MKAFQAGRRQCSSMRSPFRQSPITSWLPGSEVMGETRKGVSMEMCISQQNLKSKNECKHLSVEYTCSFFLKFGPAFTKNSRATFDGMMGWFLGAEGFPISQLQGRWRVRETSVGKWQGGCRYGSGKEC